MAQRCQIRGQRAIERQAASRYWMLEAEMAGMQSLPAKIFNHGAHTFAEPPCAGCKARRIDWVGDNRMSDVRHVHSDLVRAAGLEL